MREPKDKLRTHTFRTALHAYRGEANRFIPCCDSQVELRSWVSALLTLPDHMLEEIIPELERFASAIHRAARATEKSDGQIRSVVELTEPEMTRLMALLENPPPASEALRNLGAVPDDEEGSRLQLGLVEHVRKHEARSGEADLARTQHLTHDNTSVPRSLLGRTNACAN